MQWIAIVIGVVNTAIGVILAVRLLFVEGRTRKIESMEAELKANAERLIEAQITARTGELVTMIKLIGQQVAQINDRLSRGDADFKSLSDRDQKVELRTQQLIGEVREQMATREDIQKLWNAIREVQHA
jgi:uncharacterized membrane-anchored protein YhcB (DUF1043 family)